MLTKTHWLVIDLETTGRDFLRHEILQIGGVLLNEQLATVKEWSAYVIPERWQDADPEAMRVNGIARAEVNRTGLPLGQALAAFEREFLSPDRPLAWATFGPDFDKTFITSAYAKVGRRNPWPSVALDLRTVASLCAAKVGPLGYLLIAQWADLLGIARANGRAHDALCDARLAAACMAASVRYLELGGNARYD